jgi:predicted flavoprotein YhiN
MNQILYIIVGGGAAGFYSHCIVEDKTKVAMLERGADVLQKSISGGGRCNVTAYFDP